MKNLLLILLTLASLARLQAQCSVSISIQTSPVFGDALVAVVDSSNNQIPLSFNWSNGQSGEIIYPFAPGNYCVIVLFNSGCTATACIDYQSSNCGGFGAYIASDSSGLCAGAFGGTEPYSYSWTGGATTSCISTPSPGIYCVSVADAAGCLTVACDTTTNSSSCSVYLTQDPAGPVQAHPIGIPPFLYAWSDPTLSGPTVFPVGNWTELCVTVTDASGCISSSCITNSDTMSCWTNIAVSFSNTGEASLFANTSINVANYAWNTGETTQSITVTQPGNYCVTVTYPDGCTANACETVNFNSNLSVWVFASDSTLQLSGDLWLIQYDSTGGGTLTAIDTVPYQNNYATISNLAPGLYLIKASIAAGTVGYTDHLPTYYYNSLYWNTAQTVFIAPGAPSTLVINMIEGQNPGGPGFIGGLVSEGANFGGVGDDRNEGDPIPGVDIILTLEDGTPVKAVKTGSNGKYAFSNLNYGTYHVQIDMPFVAPAFKIVTISPNTPSIENINFKADDDSAALSVHSAVTESTIQSSPNPFEKHFTVDLDGAAVISVFNAQGERIYLRQTTDKKHTVQMGNQPAGVYILTLQYDSYTAVKKVVKL